MSLKTVDFTSTAYSKTKSFNAKEIAAKEKRKELKNDAQYSPDGRTSSVKHSSWTPIKQDLNEKLFLERKELVNNWFEKWTDTQRRQILEDVIVGKCKPSQLQFIFSLVDYKVPITHVDFTRKLPRVICIYIFAFLDPRSLCRCAQVSWYWKYLTELDHIWMPKCLRFGWYLSFVPSPFETGVWKRHYLESVRSLQYVRPKSPRGSPALSRAETSQSGDKHKRGVYYETAEQSYQQRKAKGGTLKQGAWEAPPWRGPDPRPTDAWRKTVANTNTIIGCSRCHRSTHVPVDELSNHPHQQHRHTDESPAKKGSTKMKPRIKPASSSFAPDSHDTWFDTKTGRPDWAVQASITPVSAERPPPPVVQRPALHDLDNQRPNRQTSGEESLRFQPWKLPRGYESD